MPTKKYLHFFAISCGKCSRLRWLKYWKPKPRLREKSPKLLWVENRLIYSSAKITVWLPVLPVFFGSQKNQMTRIPWSVGWTWQNTITVTQMYRKCTFSSFPLHHRRPTIWTWNIFDILPTTWTRSTSIPTPKTTAKPTPLSKPIRIGI